MITISTNTTEVIGQLEQQIGLLFDSDKMLRLVASSMVPVLRKRVHEDGLAADGSPIGIYTPGYLEERQKNPNARTSSPKVIISRHRQLENDLGAIPIEGGWGIGFITNHRDRYSKEENPPTNYEKVLLNEFRYQKKIHTALTREEEQLAYDIAEDYVNEVINAIP